MTKQKNAEFLILEILILYMPLHYIICEIILDSTSFDNIMRDLVIVILMIYHISINGFKVNKTGLALLSITVIMSLFMLTSLFCGNVYSVNIFRTYAIPSLVYFIIKDIRVDKKRIIKLIRMSLIEMCLIGIWGGIQAFALGDSFLVKIGYPTVDGVLGASFYINGYYGIQRSVGTFVSSNYCGLILGIFSILAIIVNHYQIIKVKKIIIILLIGGMLATISRSAILSFIIAMFFFFLICNKKFSGEKALKAIGMIVLCVGVLLLCDLLLLNGIVTKMLIDALWAAVSFSDLSSQKHLLDIIEVIPTIVENPLGLGFGYNGPMAFEHVINSKNVESSIYLMMYEMGPVLGIMYFVPFVRCVVTAPFSNKKNKTLSATIILMILITFIFLPNVQSFEVLFYLFLFLGVYDNDKYGSEYNWKKRIVLKQLSYSSI